MPRASVQQREVKEKASVRAGFGPVEFAELTTLTAAGHRHGKEPVSTRPACQPVLSRQC